MYRYVIISVVRHMYIYVIRTGDLRAHAMHNASAHRLYGLIRNLNFKLIIKHTRAVDIDIDHIFPGRSARRGGGARQGMCRER